MKGLISEITALEITVAAFTRKANLSFRTVKRIDRGEVVQPHNLVKAQNALTKLKAEFGFGLNTVGLRTG